MIMSELEAALTAAMATPDLLTSSNRPGQREAVLGLLHELTARLQPGDADVHQIVSSRENAARLIEFVARHQSAGKGWIAFAELQRKLKFRTMQNLSMLLAWLEKQQLVIRRKHGRKRYIELLPAGRHYAVKQGWLAEVKIEIPPQRYFGPQSKISAPIRRGDL